MGYLITAIVFGFIGLLTLVCTRYLASQEAAFQKNKHVGKAEITNYYAIQGHRYYDLSVKILELNDGKEYLCKCGRIISSDYQKGMIVDVIYSKYKVMGVEIVDVRLLNNMPNDTMRTVRIINMFVKIAFAIAAILATIGIAILI